MPELPEVETIAGFLRNGAPHEDGGPHFPGILGLTAARTHLLWERSLETPSAGELAARLPGQSLVEIGRRGKYLRLGFERDTLLIHLRMSGDLRVEPVETPAQPHDRFHLDFTNGLRLSFNDPRKFGRLWLVADPQTILASLGPEPLEPSYSAGMLYQGLQARRRQLKPLLLDQTFIAGLGNIYTDEALHRARLHPLALSSQVNPFEAEALLAGIRQALEDGIRHNGASIDWVYRGGNFQNYFRVYQRTGQPCLECGAVIERKVIGQRSTHFCPQCQKLPSPGQPA
jgi:formamidopyrimidine-DNA glycosylase